MTGYQDLPPAVREQAELLLTRKQLDVLKLRMEPNPPSYVQISLWFGVAESTIRGHERRAHQILGLHLTAEQIREMA